MEFIDESSNGGLPMIKRMLNLVYLSDENYGNSVSLAMVQVVIAEECLWVL